MTWAHAWPTMFPYTLFYMHVCMNVYIQRKLQSYNPEKTAALIHIQAPRHFEAASLIRDQRRRE